MKTTNLIARNPKIGVLVGKGKPSIIDNGVHRVFVDNIFSIIGVTKPK